jgi:hypothetical protein
VAIEKAIRDYVLANSTVASLIGTRLTPEVLDQSWTTTDGPAVTYEIISTDDEHTLSDRAGLTHSRFQFVCYADSRMAANAAARAIKNSGIAAIKGTYSNVSIRGVKVESGLRTYVEKPDDGKASFRYLAEFDLMVSYIEG